ncbi:uncharacterized protein A4U43_C07F17680 [Asparagus officinalis]|uniref:1-phosphatidylinositol 4-kinase n=1 Tax=Asparagus officinalis TaxID=4686 RepID=A0A5P1EHY2_ASPOF|nr:phosphatidylinositol 4-kinase gamma 8-like [Asparagus officinalis]ONK63670.1 uncharacterized protein A4U43_C07F17680 [Asparagus officinalis]
MLGRPAGSRVSMYASETGLREVAAYLLDHGSFSGVPPTALIKISHPSLHSVAGSPSGTLSKKIASIQRFVPHNFDAGDLGPSRFSVTSVHRIGILDVRLLNIDRHAGNILVRKHVTNGSYRDEPSPMAELVPIDHGLCLPEFLDDPYFEWWPQSTVPFSEIETEYISVLDPFKDATLLRSELPSLKESAIRIFILCTIFLKRAAAEGLCLADIGSMMTRDFCGIEEQPSVLEALCNQAEDSIRTRSTSFFLEDDSSSEDSDYSDDDEDDEPIVQFEMECDDVGFTKSCIENVLDIPLFLRSMNEVKSNVLGTLSEGGGEEDNGDNFDDERDEPKLGSITKSLSLTAAELNHESGESSSGKCISFNRMSEEQWGLFLERFEQLLPVAFEARKSMGLKQRLGTSCKF